MNKFDFFLVSYLTHSGGNMRLCVAAQCRECKESQTFLPWIGSGDGYDAKDCLASAADHAEKHQCGRVVLSAPVAK